MNRRFVQVALPPPLARELTYAMPLDWEVIRIGTLVLVPVGKRLVTGVVVEEKIDFEEQSINIQVRDVNQILDDELLTDEIVKLCTWLAEYYLAPLGSALMLALPPGVKLTSKRIVTVAENVKVLNGKCGDEHSLKECDDDEKKVMAELFCFGSLKVSTLQHRFGRKRLEKKLITLKRRGLININSHLVDRRTRSRSELHIELIDRKMAEAILPDLTRRAKRQYECLNYLLDVLSIASSKLRERGYSSSVINALEKRGLVKRVRKEVRRDPLADIDRGEDVEIKLTPDQDKAVKLLIEMLDKRCFHSALLFGVTGSGKTIVYIELVRKILSQNRSAIILVPEIALAWQMVRRFMQYFGEDVVVLHSQLSSGERYDTWKRLREGDAKIVIGARSAIFAPLRNLGIIVVDEEHDSSYKQEDLESSFPLNYNARDVAVKRARDCNALIVLGSATPSLESFSNAKSGKYTLYTLPKRIDNRPLPTVHVVDMTREPFQKKQRPIFSKSMRLKITDCLKRNEQILLLQNRRGFSPFINCSSCGEFLKCVSCHISLTYHRTKEGSTVKCHYCNFSKPIPSACESCGVEGLHFDGVGTQKVEEELTKQFPNVRVIRMDVDTTGWKGAHDKLVERFRRREADILLGTQMVAKGLDFPNVTLVGVISADTGIHMPDFRAAERSFQLLTQVAGRSGRGTEPGEVVVQTRLPDDPVLKTAAKQDFLAFAERELNEREEAGFPPFGRLLVLRWRGGEDFNVETAAREGVNELIRHVDSKVFVLGPAPAPISRLRGMFRWQALVRGPSAFRLREITHNVWPVLNVIAKRYYSSLTVNVDPLTIM